ncbi:MAG: Do family serine endopeptidase [Phycisphaerales bacterium]|nr:Do family serine endopeptidase [Phycisphaerales bacterium]
MQVTRNLLWPLVAAIALAGGSYLGTVELNRNTVRGDSPSQTAKPTPELPSESFAQANELSQAFRSVHRALEGAVVNIHVVNKNEGGGGDNMQRRSRLPDGFQLPPGFELPPGFGPNDMGGGGGAPRVVEGTGSGVIVSPDGYILTNNHVVDNATDITVTLNDGRDFKAKVVGTDPKTDLAVVKITADHLTYAKFGDSDVAEVGDWVLAFGSPFGLEQSMTQGIISAKGRSIGIIGSRNDAIRGYAYENFLQTDAAINPGNSGGPLVNLRGEVIGINTAIASNSGGYNGVGFAIPSNDARFIMDSLIQHGTVVRGFLNVKIEDFNRPMPQDQGLVDSIKKQGFTGKGALVSEVAPDGPAGKGGVQSGDVITAFNGKPVETVVAFRNQVARTAPGTKIDLTVFRDGKSVELSFPLGTQPAMNAAYAENAEKGPAATENNELGIAVKSVDAATAKKYRLGNEKGVIVTDVAKDSLAGTLGIRPGDVITRVGKTDVNSAKELTDALAAEKLSEGLRLTLRSADGMERVVFVQKK